MLVLHDAVLIVISVITGTYAVKAARTGSKINSKVGNGFTEHVQNDLREIRDNQSQLLGKFEEHIKEHEKWSYSYGNTRIPEQRQPEVLD